MDMDTAKVTARKFRAIKKNKILLQNYKYLTSLKIMDSIIQQYFLDLIIILG